MIVKSVFKKPFVIKTKTLKLSNFFHIQKWKFSNNSSSNSNGKKGYILCSDPINKSCVEILEKAGFGVDTKQNLTQDQLVEIIPKYRGLIVRSETKVTQKIMQAGKNLELIGRAGTGVDNIDMNAANKLGKVIMNTPGGNTISTAELTISMIFALARSIPQATASLKAGKWDRKSLQGIELNGKTLGVIGLGRIGREVAKFCKIVGMKIVGYDPIMSQEAAREHDIEKVNLEKLFSVSDFITIHTPLTDETKDLLNKETFELCKKGVRIVNCARGGIVNEKDLLEAINSGKVAGAALDAFSVEPPTKEIYELLQHPAIICTPHLGASTSEAQSKVAVDIATQFVKAFEQNEYIGVVNASFIGLSKQQHLLQYLELSERLGSILGQLLEGSLKKLTLNIYGKELSKDQVSDILSNSTLKGLLQHLITDQVNLINAPYLAEDHGLKIVVNRFEEVEKIEINNTIEVILETDSNRHTIAGTVYKDDLIRIIKIDNFKVELNPTGNIVLFENNDQPGVIAAVTSVLAKENINIADFSLGRLINSALGVITTDEEVNDECLEKLRALPNLINAKRISLPQFFLSQNSDGKPKLKPTNPNFGSGPCSKRPGYDLKLLPTNLLGRSHRSTPGKARINKATQLAKKILEIPSDYSVGIVPASDTGAVEMSLWSLLSKSRPVDVVYMDAFGNDWYKDISKELKLNTNKIEAPFGKLPDLSKTNTKQNDLVFTWNGTTSGVKIPNGNWISGEREGLSICDATSAAFAMELPWNKLDITTFSWQKVLGGEAAHGIIVASPRAMEKFKESTTNRPWPMPKIFRFTEDIFTGNVINTPSLLCIEDFIDALNWAESIGGLKTLIKISQENLSLIEKFVAENDWISFLAEDKSYRSNTSICLKLNLDEVKLKEFLKILEKENVAFDINSYKSAPPGIRIWGGATIVNKDIKALLPWLKWAYEKVSY